MKRTILLSFLLLALLLLSELVFSSWTCKKNDNTTPTTPKVIFTGLVLLDTGNGYGTQYNWNNWIVQVQESATGQYANISKGDASGYYMLQIEKGKAKALYATGVLRGTGLNGNSTVLKSCRSPVYYLTSSESQNGASINILFTIK